MKDFRVRNTRFKKLKALLLSLSKNFEALKTALKEKKTTDINKVKSKNSRKDFLFIPRSI